MGVKVLVLALMSEMPGAGKTTTLRALASAYLAANRSVFIANAGGDSTASNRPNEELGQWALKLLARHDDHPTLDYRDISSADHLDEKLEIQQRQSLVDVVLVDTGIELEAVNEIARSYANIVIMPSKATSQISAPGSKFAIEDRFELTYTVRMASHECRRLRSALPESELFANQQEGGHLPKMLDAMLARTGETPKSPARFKASRQRRQAAKAAWAAAQSLALEIEWLGRGYGLEVVG